MGKSKNKKFYKQKGGDTPTEDTEKAAAAATAAATVAATAATIASQKKTNPPPLTKEPSISAFAKAFGDSTGPTPPLSFCIYDGDFNLFSNDISINLQNKYEFVPGSLGYIDNLISQ